MIRTPIHIVIDSDLKQNGGKYELMGGSVRRVDCITRAIAIADNDNLHGGALTPVYFVTDEQLAASRFKLAGGKVASGETYLYENRPNRGIKGHVAIPVYDPVFTYWMKVLSYDPIAYWRMAELSGLVAYDEVTDPNHKNVNQSGDYVGVTLGQRGIGDGHTCPFWDGANDYLSINTAALSGAFNGSEGTALIWGRIPVAATWTNGTTDNLLYLNVDADNNIRFYKSGSDDQLYVRYEAGTTVDFIAFATTTTAWFSVAMTWSKTRDQVKVYFNGSQQGATQTGLGVWGAGALAIASIGSQNDAGALNVWNGYLAHCALWGTALDWRAMDDLGKLPT